MKYSVNHKENPKEYKRQQTSDYRSRDPIRYLLNQAKYRAKKNGIEFNITKDDLDIPNVCPVFQIPLYFTKGRRTDNSYSLDRVNNNSGYIKGNVRIISWKANQYKGDLTIEEVKNLLKYMEGITY